MAKKPTKKELQAAAAESVNRHLAAGTADQLTLEIIFTTLPGGAGGEAQIYACQSLKANPGMTMEALQADACAEAELNFGTAGWIVGRVWGDHKGFGGLDYLWERRHEKLEGDKRARWHYYLLPAGVTLANADPRTNTRNTNLGRINSYAKPGDLVIGKYHVFDGYTGASSDWHSSRESWHGEIEERVFIASCYLGMVREWSTDPAGNAVRKWDFIEASGPGHENWHRLMGSRQLFLGCISDDGVRVAIAATTTKASK